MCRYAFYSYKPHYACFDCRKMFRRRLLNDIDRDEKVSVDAKCPQCGGYMANMGLDFKPPKKDDLKAWKHLCDLYSVGITYHSCGCSGPGYIPKTKEKIIEYLETTKGRYIENFRLWNTIELPETKAEFEKFYQREFHKLAGTLPPSLNTDYKKRRLEKKDAVEYWSEKIKEIEKYIESFGLKTN
ncbi:hypothetical protein [Dysgonomonas sp. 511]|uniref:hypothetical protein n=1 Tax=Dysgonomonas sp. 511 TaxID=2302930 RepID=UPI0013D460A0|nr:hypothetical protein [Dysgonomonas sp. 511]NDV79034.1 hypothetical protein [Dysgonomonas sp. 511]